MDRNRLWLIGLVAVMVAVVAMGWLLGIQPQLAAATSADQSRAEVQSENATNETVLAKLKKDYSSIGELKQQLISLRQSVPASPDMSAFVAELDTLSGSHQVTVKTIAVSDAMPYTPPVAPPAAATSTASPSPSPSPTPTPVAAAPTTPPAPPAVTNSKITAANFIAIPIQLSLSGTYSNVLDFVNGLQMGPRLFLVTKFSTTASSDPTAAPGAVDATVGGYVYVVLDPNAVAAAATASPTPTPKPKATPIPKSTTTPTPTSTPTPTTTPGG